MRLRTIVGMLLVLLPAVAQAQFDWVVTHLQTTAIAWNSVAFTDDNHGTIVGSEGVCWTTFDGGSTWVSTNFGSSNTLYRVRYLDATTGYLAGMGGTLMKTTDGGTIWASIDQTHTNAFFDVFFRTDMVGIAVGQAGLVMVTGDGGGSWSTPNGKFMGNNVYGVAFPTSSIAYIVGNAGKISKSTNGGTSWNSQNSGVSSSLSAVDFGSATVGTAIGTNGIILNTSNGGTAWTQANVNIPISSIALRGIQYVSATEAFIVGYTGTILRSNDGGKNWTAINCPVTDYLEGVHFLNSNDGRVVGWNGLFMRTKLAGELEAPVLASPANDASQIALSGNLSWNAVAGATNYTVQVSKQPDFGSTVLDQAGVSGTTQAFSGLENSVVYYWRVRGANAQRTGPWSAVWHFTTIGPPPDPPQLQSPADDSTRVPTSKLLIWYRVNGAASYDLQLATDMQFTALLKDTANVTATSLLSGVLANSTMYYWRVRAKNANGTGAWCTAWKFTTVGVPPDVPQLLDPRNDTTGYPLSGTLRWSTSNGATGYWVQLSTAATFATGNVLDKSAGNAVFQLYSGLSNGVTYYWRVRASNDNGNSDWSPTWSFTTVAAAPPAPVLASPANDSTGLPLSGLLTWNAVAGAASYNVQISRVTNFGTRIVDTTGIVDGEYTYGGLLASLRYYWRVQAVNAGGASPWSTVWSFTTLDPAPAAPVLRSPADSATGVDPTGSLVWNTVTSATSYQAQLSAAPDFAATVLDKTVATLTQTSYSGLDSAKTYYWRVRAFTNVTPGPWSAIWSFTTLDPAPAAPVLLSPVNNSPTADPAGTLSWSTVPSATSYQVQLSAASDFASTLIDSTAAALTQLAYAGLDSGKTYYWRARAFTNATPGPWSAAWSFTTKASTLDAAHPGQPASLLLAHAYPNPAGAATFIELTLPQRSQVLIRVVTPLGQDAGMVFSGECSEGVSTLRWSPAGLPAGLYFLHIEAGAQRVVRAVIIGR